MTICSLRAIVLVFIVVFAVMSSAASAAQIEVEGGGETGISAAQEGRHVFSIEGNKLECATGNFEAVGNTANGATEVTVHPVYEGCSAFGFIEAVVKTTGCNFKLSAPGGEETGMRFAANLVIGCGGGQITGEVTATLSGNTTTSSGIRMK